MMRKILFPFLVLGLFFTFNGAFAQGGSKGKKEKPDAVQQSTDYLAQQLALDDFQKAAVREIVESEKDAMHDLEQARDITINERRDRMAAITDRIYQKVLPLLSKEQAEKYTKIQAERKF